MLAEHGVELLPEQVIGWMGWMEDNIPPIYDLCPCDERHDPNSSMWCHLILEAQRHAPGGPASCREDVLVHAQVEHVLEAMIAEVTDEFDEDGEDVHLVVLPLAVYAKALALASSLTAATPKILGAYLQVVNAANDEEYLSSPADLAPEEHPSVRQLMMIGMELDNMAPLHAMTTLMIRDTAGDIEVPDGLIDGLADSLVEFSNLSILDAVENTIVGVPMPMSLHHLAAASRSAAFQLYELIEESYY